VIPLTLPQTPNRYRAGGPCPRRRRLRDLHLRHDRYAKGVAISHHNLTQLIASQDAGLPPASEQAWSHWHSYAFDFSVWEIFGRCCAVADWWWCPNRWRTNQKISRLPGLATSQRADSNPSAIGMLAAEGLESTALVMGGEACPAEVVDKWAPADARSTVGQRG